MRHACLAILIGSFWMSSPARGQIFATLDDSPQPVAGTAPEVETAPNRLQRRLEQVETLIVDELWDEAINTLEQAQLDAGSAVEAPGGYLFEQEPGYYLPLAKVCQLRLANLPEAGLSAYRQRVDALAEEWFLDGRDRRDVTLLQRVVNEFFASSWADDALAQLGQIALERGDYVTARRCWRQVHPWLSSPDGRPLAWALQGIDLNENADAVRRLIKTPSGQSLGYPDSNLDFAPLMTGMILASLYEGDSARAATEIEVLQLLAPKAEGVLAGQKQALAPALRQLLADAENWPQAQGSVTWPTAGGNVKRDGRSASIGQIAGSLWPEPYRLPQKLIPAAQRNPRFAQLLQAVGTPPSAEIPEVVVADGKLLLANTPVRCFDLLTGQPAGSPQGVLFDEVAPAAQVNRQRNLMRFNGRIVAMPNVAQQAAPPHVSAGIAYALVPAGTKRVPGNVRQQTQTKILGIDLQREGLTTLELSPPELPWRFGGPPVVRGGKLFVVLSADDVRPRMAVACYSIATGKQVWQVEVCSGQPVANWNGASQPANILTLGLDTVYCNTNLGAVAALDAKTGNFRWVRFYDRLTSGVPRSMTSSMKMPSVNPGAITLSEGRLYVTPSDAQTLFALDAITGRLLWVRDQPDQQASLLGVAQGRLVLGGRQLTILDSATGKRESIWPASPKSGLRGAGHGCLAGSEIFWPTRDRLFVFDLRTGQQSRQSIDLTPYGDAGANVVPAYGCLAIVGNKAMTVLGPVKVLPPPPPATLSQVSPN